jgi:NTE family protein
MGSNGFAGDSRWLAKPPRGTEMSISRILGRHRPPGHTEETAMHHAISHQLAQARRGRRRPSPRTVLAIAALGSAVAFVDITIVNIAFPDIVRSFPGTSIATLSWVLNAYNIVFAAFLVAAAGIADRLGRRRVFVVGLQLFTAGSLACAIAPSADALIAFRIVQALGAAFLVPSALAPETAGRPASVRRSPGCCCSAARTRPRRPAATPTW